MSKIIAKNKKAYFSYTIIDKFEVGIVLHGTEVKSIRQGKVNIKDGYAVIRNGEVFLQNCHISPYSHGTYDNHDPLRVRKLLMHKLEIRRLVGKVKESALTLVPLKLYITQRGLVKLEIGLAKGKKLHDKRESMKAKSAKREIARVMKGRNYE